MTSQLAPFVFSQECKNNMSRLPEAAVLVDSHGFVSLSMTNDIFNQTFRLANPAMVRTRIRAFIEGRGQNFELVLREIEDLSKINLSQMGPLTLEKMQRINDAVLDALGITPNVPQRQIIDESWVLVARK